MRRLLLLAAAAALLACGDADAPSARPGEEPTAEEAARALAARGARLYRTHCVACHHLDPARDGGLGPAVAGSSIELLEAKVLRNEYPPGHTPKQDTQMMAPLPFLEPDIPALAAFLEDAKR